MGIARVQFLVAGVLWVMCWNGQEAIGQSVGIRLLSRTYANNSIVNITDIGATGHLALLCTTTYLLCCTASNPETQWYFPNGNAVQNPFESGILLRNLPYSRFRLTDGTVRLNRNPEGTTTGIFHCDIPDASGVLQSLYVGIYTSTTGVPTATTLVYNGTTRSLTCTSTGGPATTVTWRKDGAIITVSAAYQQTKVVTNATTGTYETVLTIDQSVNDILGRYSCTVGNVRGTSAAVETTLTNPSPPQMFHITAATTNSLSFSWQEPAIPNGVVTGYELSCQPLLLGISVPQQLNPGSTDQMSVLGNLQPGVTYNCSIRASNGAGHSILVSADGTTMETAPNGPPQSFIVIPSAGAQNVTFSWSPPAPTLRNGIITGYSLSCVPEGGRESTVSMHYTQTGTFTLEGFAPATKYNCSISASNSEGSGPVANTTVATMEDVMLFQLRLNGVPTCQEWVGVATSAKLTDINSAVVQNTEQLCQCGLTADHITEDAFECFANSEQKVTFRAKLHGTAQATSSQLLTNIETWVAQMDSTIAIQGVRLHVDSSCLIAISTFSDPECTRVAPTSNSALTAGAIVGGVVVILVILAVIITVISVLVIKNRKAGSSIAQVKGNQPTKSRDGGNVIARHDIHELTKLGHDSEDHHMFEARQPSHELGISTTPCSAYMYTSWQGSGRVEEPEYEFI